MVRFIRVGTAIFDAEKVDVITYDYRKEVLKIKFASGFEQLITKLPEESWREIKRILGVL